MVLRACMPIIQLTSAEACSVLPLSLNTARAIQDTQAELQLVA